MCAGYLRPAGSLSIQGLDAPKVADFTLQLAHLKALLLAQLKRHRRTVVPPVISIVGYTTPATERVAKPSLADTTASAWRLRSVVFLTMP